MKITKKDLIQTMFNVTSSVDKNILQLFNGNKYAFDDFKIVSQVLSLSKNSISKNELLAIEIYTLKYVIMINFDKLTQSYYINYFEDNNKTITVKYNLKFNNSTNRTKYYNRLLDEILSLKIY